MSDSTVSALTEITTLSGDELVYVVEDPAGTPLDRKVTATNLKAYIGTFRGARVYRSAAQTLTTATVTAIAFDAESFDTNALHDNVTNNSRVLLNQVGTWSVTCNVRFASNSTGVRQVRINRNGSIHAIANLPAGGSDLTVVVSDVINATATTDYVGVDAYQTSGGDLDVLGSATETFLAVVYLGA